MTVVVFKHVRIVQSTGAGSLIVYASWLAHGGTTTIHRLDENGKKGSAYYAPVNEFKSEDGKTIYAAVFPTLASGNYTVSKPGYTNYHARTVTIFPGNTLEVHYA